MTKPSKLILKKLISNWLLPELIEKYDMTPSFSVLKGYRVFKVLKFLRLIEPTHTNKKDIELLCVLSDSNHSIFARITTQTIRTYESKNRRRITEDTTNTLIISHNLKVYWLSRDQLVQEFGSEFACSHAHCFAVLEIDELMVVDWDRDKVGRTVPLIYTTEGYVDKIRPLNMTTTEEFEV